jgi:uroporphyrinogen-III synthase
MNSRNRQPLTGVRVLVGRARHQAGALSAELRKLGADVLEIPFIEIRKPRSFRPLDTALRNLASYDWLILTSVNGVDAMWERMLHKRWTRKYREGVSAGLRVAAIGPATKKAIERRGGKVDVVPKEYVAESVVRCLKSRVKAKRVLLVRAKIARDVIPRELRRVGAHVDVVEAYETVVPESSSRRLRAALQDPKKRPHVVTFTSSSTVRNFAQLLGAPLLREFASTRNVHGKDAQNPVGSRSRRSAEQLSLHPRMASIGPVTSSTLRELGLEVEIAARQFTIPGLVRAIVKSFRS